MSLDIERTGYDNLFLIGGYDWQAKFVAAGASDWEAKAALLTANFDKIKKDDILTLAKWENEVLHACGLPGKPLPKPPAPPKKEAVKEAPKAEAVEPPKADTAK